MAIEVMKKTNLRGSFISIINITLKIKTVMFSANISDKWKEIVIPTYAFQIMLYSSKIIITLLVVIAIILVINVIFMEFLDLLFSLTGIILSIVISTAYILARVHLLK